MTIIKFTDGDKRIVTLISALEDVIYERGQGLSFAAIIGAIEMLKVQLTDNQREEIS